LLNIRKKYACLVSGRLPGWKINLVMMFADPQLAAEKCVTLAPGVRRIVAGNAGLMTGPLAGPLAKRTGARLIGLPPPDDGRQDGAFAPDLRSLDKLQSVDFEWIAPGHGLVMEHGKEVLTSLREHRLARERKVLRSLRQLSAASLDELTPVVYDDVAAERHRWARLTLEAHLIKLQRERRASESGGLWRPGDGLRPSS
jgi:hypothetical protein